MLVLRIRQIKVNNIERRYDSLPHNPNRMKFKILFLFVIFCVVFLFSCNPSPSDNPENTNEITAPVLEDRDSADVRYTDAHSGYGLVPLSDGDQIRPMSYDAFAENGILYFPTVGGFIGYNESGIPQDTVNIPIDIDGRLLAAHPLPDGNTALISADTAPRLITASPDGEILSSTDLPPSFYAELNPVLADCTADQTQYLLIYQGNDLYLYPYENGVPTSPPRILFLAQNYSGTLRVLHTDSGDLILIGEFADSMMRLDPATGKTEPYPITPPAPLSADCRVLFDLQDRMYFANADGIFSAENGETPLLRWNTGAVSYTDHLRLHILNASHIIVYKQYGMDWENAFYLLSDDTSAQKSRRIVTLAVCTADPLGYIPQLVNAFNEQSTDYFVEIRRYDATNTDDAIDDLQKAYLWGNAPDMLCLYPYPYRQLLSALGDKGAFLDLTPYYSDRLLGGICDAYTVDGAMYFFPLAFEAETLVAASSLTAEPLNVSRMLTAADRLQNGEMLFSETGLTDQLLKSAISSFYSTDDKSCSFDSEEFRSYIRLLEQLDTRYTDPALGSFNQPYGVSVSVSDIALRDNLQTGKLKFLKVDFFSPVHYLALRLMYGDTPFTLCGFPSERGSMSVVGAHMMGIRADSDNLGGVRAFLDFALSDAAQTSELLTSSFLPVTASAIRSLLDRYTYTYWFREEDYRDYTVWENGREIVIGKLLFPEFIGSVPAAEDILNAYADDGMPLREYILTEEDKETFLSFFEHAAMETVTAKDSVIESILKEELSAYDSGAKTLEDVSKLIQSRVWIYLNE